MKRLLDKLASRIAKARRDASASVAVVYTAPYAVYVHEDLEAFHAHGQAKFLEQPMRENRGELGQLIHSALADNRTLSEALTVAGTALLAYSQELVPVATGALKDSGSVQVEA